jgi:hypothetical protein
LKKRFEAAKKPVIAGFCVIALLWGIGCVALYRIMLGPPESFARVMSKIPGPVPFLVFPFETLWTHARSGRLNRGAHAPDFALNKLDHSSQIQLSALNAGKPVVLVFGSYT